MQEVALKLTLYYLMCAYITLCAKGDLILCLPPSGNIDLNELFIIVGEIYLKVSK